MKKKYYLFEIVVLLAMLTSFGTNAQSTPDTGCETVLDFNGSNQYVSVAEGVYFGDNTFTIETWLYLRSYNTWERIIDFGNGSNVQNLVLAASNENSGQPTLGIYMNGGTENITADTALPLNTWVHLAVVRNGNDVLFYFNGNLVSSGSASIAVDSISRTSNYVGKNSGSDDSFYDGRMDEVRIWSTARTQTEIQNAMNVQLAGNESGLVAYWDMNDQHGYALKDKTAHGYDGALQNMDPSANWLLPDGTAACPVPVITGGSYRSACPGSQATVAQASVDGPAIGYQWYKDGTLLPGQTTAALTLNVTSLSGGNYWVAVQNSTGSVASDPVTVSTDCNSALSFDNAYVDFGDPAALNFADSNSFTIETWVKPYYDSGGLYTIFSKSVANSAQGFYLATQDNDFILQIGDETANFNSVFSANTWTHIAITYQYDVNSHNGYWKMYRDRELVANYTKTYENAPVHFYAGARNSDDGTATSDNFAGQLDEFRIWNGVATQDDIQANMYRQTTGHEPSLVAYYDFNLGVPGGDNTFETILPDRTVHLINGTLSGFALTGDGSNFVSSGVSVTGIYAIAAPVINDITVPSASYCPGSKVYVGVDASGSFLTYQWYKDGVLLPGHTTTGVTIDSVTMLDRGHYWVVIKNAADSVISNKINLVTGCNNALNFNGNVLNLGNPTALQFADTGSFTVETWINPSNTNGGWYSVFGKSVYNSNLGFALAFADGKFILLMGNEEIDLTTPSFTSNAWTHVAVTYKNGQWMLYQNGDSVATYTKAYANANVNFYVGLRNNNNGIGVTNSYYGKIDEFRIWRKALDKAAIQAGMHTKATGREQGLVTYYDFDQGVPGGNNSAQTYVQDRTVNGNNPPISNFYRVGTSSNFVYSGVSFPANIMTIPGIVKTYGDAPFTIAAYSASYAPFSYTVLSGSGITTDSNVLSISGAGASLVRVSQSTVSGFDADYTDVTVNINKTTLIVTAFNSTIVYGQEMPAFTSTVSGLVAGDHISVTCLLNGGQIVPSVTGAALVNYTLTTIAGTFTITPADQTVTIDTIADVTLTGISQKTVTVSGSATSGLEATYSITTNPAGIATISGTVISIGSAGTVTVSGFQAGNNNYNTAPYAYEVFRVLKSNQAVTINNIADVTLSGGNATITVSGSATSGLPVTYSIATNPAGIATISGTVISIGSAGTVTVSGFQAGNNNYNTAPGAYEVFRVLKSNQAVTINNIADVTLSGGNATITVSGSATSGLPVTYNIVTNPAGIATISGTVISIGSAGTVTVSGFQAGNNNYNAAPGAYEVFRVLKSNQAVTINNISDITLSGSNATITVSGSATSGLPVTYNIVTNPAGIATLNGTVINMSGTGTITVSGFQAGNASYNASPYVYEVFQVLKNNQTVAINSIADITLSGGNATITVSGSATSGLEVTYSIATNPAGIATLNGTVININSTGTITVSGFQAGNASYNASPYVYEVFRVLTVTGKTDQTVTINSIADVTLSGISQTVTVSGSATSGLPVTYNIVTNPAGIATLSGTMISIGSAGTITVSGFQAGNDSYNAAPYVYEVFRVLTVTGKTDQTVTINSIADVTLSGGNAAITVSGAATSGLEVTYSIATNPAGIATLSGTVINMSGTGTITVSGFQAGNSSYNVAPYVYEVFQVLTVTGKTDQMVTINSIADVTLSGISQTVTIGGSATSGLPVTYNIVTNPAGIATLNGTVINIIDTGTVTVSGFQAGNASYNAAPYVYAMFRVLTVTGKTDQTVTINSIADITLSGSNATITVSGAATSGLEVTYSIITNPAGIATLNGTVINIIGTGTITVSGFQAGNSSYNAAPYAYEVFQVLTVTDKTDQTVTINSIADVTLSGISQTVTVSGAATSGLEVTYSIATNPAGIATLNGTVINMSGTGTVTVSGFQAGNNNYNASSYVYEVFQVLTVAGKTDQTVTINSIADVTLSGGNAAITVSGAATSGLEVTYSIATNPAGIATLNGTVINMSGTGTITVSGFQAGNNNYNASSYVYEVFRVLTVTGKTDQTVTINSIADVTLSGGNAAITVSGAATSGLEVTYSITTNPAGIATLNGTVINMSGTGTITVSGFQAGNNNYNASSYVYEVFQVLTVAGKTDQTVTINSIADVTLSGISQTVTVSGAATSGLEVTYSIATNPAGIATLNGTVINMSGTGSVTVSGFQAGNSSYNASPYVYAVFRVLQGTSTAIVPENAAPDFSLYPNPGKGKFTVNSKLATYYQITTAGGAIVQTGFLAEGSNAIEANLPSGFYMIMAGHTAIKLMIE